MSDVKPETEATPIEVDATPAAESSDSKPAAPSTELGPAPKVEGKDEKEVEELLAKSAKQVYFYFSDSNLPVDKYFFSLTCCNAEGWVPIKTILTFKRMREFQALGVPFVVYALQKAIKDEGNDALVAISEDGENVRRRRPLEPNATAWSRSAYVKGFGEEETEANSQEKIEQYFEQFGKINAVRLRRGDLEGKGPAGKGKGKFKGSVFAEFAYEADMNKFLEQESIPKFTADGPEMVKMSKDAYVTMKAKEKGIPEDEIHKGRQGSKSDGPVVKKFNAFREMEKAKKGQLPALAKIPDEVAIVGSRPQGQTGQRTNDRKRGREEDGEEREGKGARTEEPEPLIIEYKGAKLECDRHTGKVLDPSKILFENDSAVKFINHGENPDWKDLKAQVGEVLGSAPFLAFPPGAAFGTIAKSDSSVFTDEDLEKFRAAKMQFGGAEVEWARMSEQEQRNFWNTRANFQGKNAADKLNEQDEKKQRGGKGGFRGGGRGRGGRGGRGGGRGRGGRGGRGGNRNAERGERGEKGERSAADPASSLPPSLKTGN
ncbi:hypothetical protein CI109_104697 [Kwoniella shandongensis]|uniref:Uncharacterized protein n=1 Tax=Kwoniella shandongensis TaxID=1734106 RepID=A0A5M6BXF9_9TREE|nr:uncharacterized protein CI109_004860 [Kwoniella shandongensis]KAA5526860.1 hypothetical protein CI109_004860 [Kwoniella shandongensis]